LLSILTFSSDALVLSRRGFLAKTLSVPLQSIISPLLLVAPEVTVPTVSTPVDSNPPLFVYSDSWTGTNLPRISLTDAASTAMTVWPMGRWPDPVLRKPAAPVPSGLFGSAELQQACSLLQNTARHHDAVGLAAQQCGVNARIVYLERPFGSLTMINPQIVQRSPETEMRVWTEHCLVLPQTFAATVLRDAWITVEYQEASTGAWKIVTLRGELARAAQHELDHDRGILVTDHVELSELENDYMRSIETAGHAGRMELAYSRAVEKLVF
jgi:peptide deformylase